MYEAVSYVGWFTYLVFILVLTSVGWNFNTIKFWYRDYSMIGSAYSIFCEFTGWEKGEVAHKYTVKQSESYFMSMSFVLLVLVNMGMYPSIGFATMLMIVTNSIIWKIFVSGGTKYTTSIQEEMGGYKLTALFFRLSQFIILWIRISVNFLIGHLMITISTTSAFYALATGWFIFPLKLLGTFVQSYIYTYLVSGYQEELYLSH